MAQFHSHMDTINDFTLLKSSSAAGAFGTKGNSCCAHSLLATVKRSSEIKLLGDVYETSRTTPF